MRQTLEPPELLLKKVEELYALTTAQLAQQVARVDAIDAKVSRYLAIVAFVLALTGTVSGEFVERVSRAWPLKAVQLFEYLFLASYLALGVFTVIAIRAYMVALRIQQVERIPMNENLLAHFTDHRYVDVIQSLSKRNIEAFGKNDARIDRKIESARRGYNYTSIVLITGVLSVTFHVAATFMAATPNCNGRLIVSDAPQQTGGEGASDATQEPTPLTIEDVTPNPAVEAPRLEQEDRGFEGGTTPSSPPQGSP